MKGVGERGVGSWVATKHKKNEKKDGEEGRFVCSSVHPEEAPKVCYLSSESVVEKRRQETSRAKKYNGIRV